MAEGDTILRTARRLESALGGETVAASAPSARGRATGVERLDGMTLERVEARGKHLLLRFDGLVLHSHLGMNGSWDVHRRGARTRKPLRRAWALLAGQRAEAAQFGGPTLRVLTAAAVRADPVLSRLGPDVLAASFDPEASVALLRANPGRALGEALLDQAKVAGIGNIFKSEACFAARLDPWRPVGGLSDAELERVLLAARELMTAVVEGGRRERAAYGRSGRPCPRCGAPIRSAGQGDDNRTTYWCPTCQGG